MHVTCYLIKLKLLKIALGNEKKKSLHMMPGASASSFLFGKNYKFTVPSTSNSLETLYQKT
jgi:hypothetical protein